jgi:hypothetical protein
LTLSVSGDFHGLGHLLSMIIGRLSTRLSLQDASLDAVCIRLLRRSIAASYRVIPIVESSRSDKAIGPS